MKIKNNYQPACEFEHLSVVVNHPPVGDKHPPVCADKHSTVCGDEHPPVGDEHRHMCVEEYKGYILECLLFYYHM